MREPLLLDAAVSSEIRRTVRALLAQPGGLVSATEVYMPDACDHGCKVYARRQGAVLRYTLQHARSYGCRQVPRPVRLARSPR